MSSFLSGILADPATGDTLEKENTGYFINQTNGTRYPIQNNIPNFLIETPGKFVQDSPIHSSSHTNFDYQGHYERDAELVDYFQEDEALVTKNERERNRQAIINQVPGSARVILDIGCGGTWVAAAFLPKGRQVISMDISSINPAKALEKYPQENHAAIIADAFNLPFKNESLDCIIASEVIEHVINPRKFVESVLQKLKPGGKLILMTPYNEKIRYHLCVHCNQPTPQNGHLHSFDETKILSLFPGNFESKAIAFCNNYLLKVRLYNLLSFLPFKAWRLIDSTANRLFPKPLSLMTTVVKKVII